MRFPLQTRIENNNWAQAIIAQANASRRKERERQELLERKHGKRPPPAISVFDYLLKRLLRYGVTDSLLEDLNYGFTYARLPWWHVRNRIKRERDGVVFDAEYFLAQERYVLRGDIIYLTSKVGGISELKALSGTFCFEKLNGERQLSIEFPRPPNFVDLETIDAKWWGSTFSKYGTLMFACCLDELQKVRCCESADCGDYFIGTKRAKWCSDTCGSRERLRKKRKRDKERQML